MFQKTFSKRDPDAESGASEPLYPMMLESPELRWAFIRKVYSIIILQLLLTIAVGALVIHFHPIAIFIATTVGGLVLYILIIVSLIIITILLAYYSQKHPLNYILLVLFTVSFAFVVGLSCAFTSLKVVLEAVILTAIVVVSLTLYTFWASKRGADFGFLEPFIYSCLSVLIVFVLIQIFSPLGPISQTIYGFLIAIICCAYIIIDTDYLIKRFTYDEYIWAAVAIYLDIINIFLAFLRALQRNG